jgi:hypothetical protein
LILREKLVRQIVAIAEMLRRRVLGAVVDRVHAHWFGRKTFYGCPFMAAAGEYTEPTSPIFQQSVLHKRLVMAYFEELARAAGLADAEKVAEEIQLLHEGATAVAHVSRDPAVADHAKAMALALLDKA